MTITPPKHFSWTECLWFLDRNFDDCSHTVTQNSVRKVIEIDAQLVLIEISYGQNELIVDTLVGQENKEKIKAFVTNWFDLNTDLEDFYKKISQDKNLNFLSKNYEGLRLMNIPNLFEALCWAIIGQQINLKFAYTLKRRLVELYGQKISFQGKDFWHFPSPKELVNIDEVILKEKQFSTSKIKYIKNTTEAFINGSISKENLQKLKKDDILSQLTAIKGIGKWTAEYALMKSLKCPTALPLGDAGLNKALQNIFQLPQKPSNGEVINIFEPYQGHEAYLTLYLWRSLV